MDQIEFDVTCPYCGNVFRVSSVPSTQVECECPHCHQTVVFDAPDTGDNDVSTEYSDTASSYEVLPTPSSGIANDECPNCHAKIEPGSAFCGSCGFKLPGQNFYNNGGNQTGTGNVFCPHCGQKCETNEKFCGKCGTPLFNDSIPVGGVTPIVTQDTPPVYYDEDDDNHNMRMLLAICVVVLLLIGGFLGWKYLYKGKFFKKKTELVSDSINADSAKTWEQVTFEGVMYDEDGHDCNMQVTYETDGSNVRNCVYKNVDLGGKIKMDLVVTDDTYSFSGKDGKQKFAFNVNKDNLIGPGQDGRKGLLVMMHKEGEAPQPKPNPVEMSLWSCDSEFPGEIDVKGQIGCYKNTENNDKYILRVVSYDKHSRKCVLEAYLRGQTIGKFIGDYGIDSSIDEEGYEQYSAWYNGKFHYTNGKQKDFSFWVD